MIFHVLVVLSYLAAFYIFLHPAAVNLHTPAEFVAFTFSAALMLGWISGIDTGVNYHNHVHLNVFRNGLLNLWFGRFWSVVGGWPALWWKHSHVTVHHRNVMESNDWTLPRRNADGKPKNIFVYSILLWPWRCLQHMWRDYRDGNMSAAHGKRFVKESIIFLLIWIVPFLIDPLMGLCLWLLPQFVANVCVMGPGMYAQHYGCDTASLDRPYRHSNTFLSSFFNITMFNIGYHIEHHQWPNVHWSDLPALHEERKQEIVKGGGHVVPFGYYRGGHLLSAWLSRERARNIFMEQHPDYRSEIR